MPNITITPSLKKNILFWTFDHSSTTQSSSSVYTGNETFSGTARIQFMQGPVPTDFTEFVSTGSKAPDMLVTMNSNVSLEQDSVTQDWEAVVSTAFTPAAASGVASYFWFYVYDTNSVIVNQMIGTIGTGEGFDLLVPEVNVEQGKQYRVSNLRFTIPSDFNYS